MKPPPEPAYTEEALDQRNVVELLRGAMAAEPLDGSRVIDATAGNGHDTESLAQAVGSSGEVLAIDLQSTAVDATRMRLARHPELARRVRVIRGDHAELIALAPPDWRARVALIMFNLGYLPGGDHGIKTRAESSVAAASASIELLAVGGLLCMAIYTGHPDGAKEAAALHEWAANLAGREFRVRRIRDTGVGSLGRPEVLIVRRVAASDPQEDLLAVEDFQDHIPARDPEERVGE